MTMTRLIYRAMLAAWAGFYDVYMRVRRLVGRRSVKCWAGIVLGRERHAPNDFDLRWAGAILKRNGEVDETGFGAGVLDDPVSAIAWLANRLAQYGEHIGT